MPPHKGSVQVDGRTIHWETTFDSSVNFKCSQCGYSCTASNVELSPSEVLQIEGIGKRDFAEPFASENGHSSLRIKGSESAPCIFLSPKKLCTVYGYRPSVCRLFPFKIVPISPTEVRIDVTYGCTAMLTRHFSEENEVDYGDMVARFLAHPFFGKQEHYQGALLHSTLADHLDKETALTRCWNAIIGTLPSLSRFEEVWDVIDAFEKTRSRFPTQLRRSNVDAYMEESLRSSKQSSSEITGFYTPSFFHGAHKRPYQSFNIAKREAYSFRVDGDAIIVDKNQAAARIPLSSIRKKPLSAEAKTFLIDYLSKLWERQTTRQRLEVALHEMQRRNERVPSFSLQLGFAKRKFLLLAFFMDAIAHINGHDVIELDDAREAVFPFDLLMCYLT